MMQVWWLAAPLRASLALAPALLHHGTCWHCTPRALSTCGLLLGKARRAAARKTPQQSGHLQQLVQADTHYVEKQKKEILRIFPQVKATLKNMFHNLSTNLNENYRCEEKTSAMGRISHQLVFQCTFTITWPRHLTFTGYGFNKKSAETSAALKAAEMLYRENYLTENGYPVTVSMEERHQRLQEWNLPPAITIPSHTLQEGRTLLQHYQEEVQPLMEHVRAAVSPPLPGVGLDEGDEEGPLGMLEDEDIGEGGTEFEKNPHNLLTGHRLSRQQEDAEYRSRFLYSLLQKRCPHPAAQSEEHPHLPMLRYRDDVLTALQDKQVLVISGDTGCGKSTQVPQMILDQWVQEGRGADCNILVTQPRRISAISLAKRVAGERGEAIGESVGYHVRLEFRPLRGSGGVMFCTTGMLLQGLHTNPQLAGVSHVIVDEVHERSVQTDILLILLRRLLQQRPSLRVVLMSASLSTHQLLQYFRADEAALITVPGTLYPLTRHYLPSALQVLGIKPQHHSLAALSEPDSYPSVNVDLVVDVLRAIDKSRPPGAVLCFLPGWQDISLVLTRLLKDARLQERLCILPLHSRLPTHDQEAIFEPPPPGQRKVVLATNLAETSLTVADVVYVVDTGFHKEHRYNSRTDLNVLGNHWISRANSQQRAGRAGRVQPGEVFHLYSSEVHQAMSDFPVPEIMRIPLEHVILQCKAHCGEESIRSFLAEGISVPSRRLVTTAIATLERLGMLIQDDDSDTEHLTALGRRVTHFSTPPHFSKALVLASVFRCVDPVLSISAVLTGGRGIFLSSIDLRTKTREVKVEADPTSDLLAMYSLQKEWRLYDNYADKLDFCNDKNLSYRYVKFSEGIKHLYGSHLREARLLNFEDVHSEFSSWNANRENGQLVLGVLAAGVARLLHYQRGSYTKGILNADSLAIKSEKGEHIDTTSDCVLHQPPQHPSALPPHLLCLHLSRDGVSRRTVARDLSLLQPLTVALFTGRQLVGHRSPHGSLCVSVDGLEKRSFQVDERTGQFLLELREAMDEVIEYLVETRGMYATPPLADTFCDDLVMFISKLVGSQGQKQRVRRLRGEEECF
uniref:RNA helicase n=1 Tax=Scylla olivacea TaxID=85551 RepID=A0A0P4W1J7_SCYOL